MTNAQYRKNVLHSCSMTAQDCKGSADYAAYAFAKNDENGARNYVTNLESNLSRLKAELHSLDYVNQKIKANGPEATE